MTLDLAYQLLLALREGASLAASMQGEFRHGGREFEALLAQQAGAAAERAAQRAQMESHLIMMGADRIHHLAFELVHQGLADGIACLEANEELVQVADADQLAGKAKDAIANVVDKVKNAAQNLGDKLGK